MQVKSHIAIYAFFCLIITACFIQWFSTKSLRTQWENVPPVPSLLQASGAGLGDLQFSYRTTALMLINLGSTGGSVQNLDRYDYDVLAGWFFLADQMDEKSNVIPQLAVLYYGAVEKPDKLRSIMPYIKMVGGKPLDNKWYWLAQGVYLARHKIKDLELALSFAKALADLKNPNLPIWTKQLEAFIYTEQGEKQAAYDLLKEIMISGINTLPPQEIYVMKEHVCTKILSPQEAEKDPLCQN